MRLAYGDIEDVRRRGGIGGERLDIALKRGSRSSTTSRRRSAPSPRSRRHTGSGARAIRPSRREHPGRPGAGCRGPGARRERLASPPKASRVRVPPRRILKDMGANGMAAHIYSIIFMYYGQ